MKKTDVLRIKYRRWKAAQQKDLRVVTKWINDIIVYSLKHFGELKLKSKSKHRGYCAWCQSQILANQPAAKVCDGCVEFMPGGHSDMPHDKFLHWHCAEESGCGECIDGYLKRVQ
jgi:hypothetical protein